MTIALLVIAYIVLGRITWLLADKGGLMYTEQEKKYIKWLENRRDAYLCGISKLQDCDINAMWKGEIYT